jgi:hypothetical protein
LQQVFSHLLPYSSASDVMVATTTCSGANHKRDVAGIVLDQDAEEPLHGAADRAVDHDRRLLFAVLVDIERAEALRQVEVHLRGAALPVTANGVAQGVLELRTVERALARVDVRS